MQLSVLEGGLALRGRREAPWGWSSLAMECETAEGYDVTFGAIDSGTIAETLGDRRAMLVMTPGVQRLYGATLQRLFSGTNTVATLVLDVREETKTLAHVERVCAEALGHGMSRRGLLVGVGGGVVLDIVTMSASLVRRGIGHVRIPTTLIGQIDAGIGLKGAVNFHGKKSFIGCFHPPERVLIDPYFLRSLPRRFLVSGLAEALKMAVSRDAELFQLLELCAPELVASAFDHPAAAEVLQRSIYGMLDELRQNPYEDRTYERIVDFGHTFSPSLEAALGFEITHGEAVAIDVALSSAVACKLGLIDKTLFQRIVTTLRNAALPVWSSRLDVQLCRDALTEACRHRGGTPNLVVPTALGEATFLRDAEAVPVAEALQLLQEQTP